MKPKIKELIEQCVEDGVRRGYYRAYKHVDTPTEEAMIDRITECVMSSFYEWFDFD
jgi:hypothetical protein